MKQHELTESVIFKLEDMEHKFELAYEDSLDEFSKIKEDDKQKIKVVNLYMEEVRGKRQELNLAIHRHKKSLKCYDLEGGVIVEMWEGYLMFPKAIKCISDKNVVRLGMFLGRMLAEVKSCEKK